MRHDRTVIIVICKLLSCRREARLLDVGVEAVGLKALAHGFGVLFGGEGA